MSNSQQKIFDERKEKNAYIGKLTGNIRPTCPHCGKPQNGFTHLEKKEHPLPNDFGVCFYCASVSIYDDKLMLRVATPEEVESGGENLKGIVGMVKESIERKKL